MYDQAWNVHRQPRRKGGDAGVPEAVEDSVVHFKQSHDLVVDLSTFTGDATLIVLPYDNMAAGHEVWVEFGDAPALIQEVTDETVSRPLLFTLPRAALDARLDQSVPLQFVVVVGERETYSEPQTLYVSNESSNPAPWLEPIRIEGADEGEIQPLPGGVPVYIKKPEAMQVNDELLLFVDTDSDHQLPGWLRLEDSDEDREEFVLWIEQALLESNLGNSIRLMYQYAGPGRGLSAQVLELEVTEYNPKDASVVNFKQAHDLHIDTKQFRADGVLLVPPYDDMAAGDRVALYWALQDANSVRPMLTLERTVEPGEVGFPLRFSLPRSEFPADRSAAMYFTVTPNGGTERKFRQQRLTIAAGAADSQPRLPVAALEGEDASDLIVTPDPQGKVVLVPAYSDMKLADEVYFHADGQVAAAPQFKRIELDDLGTQFLKFELAGELLKANVGDYLEMFYQFGRQGRALSAEKRRVDVKQFQDAIEISHVLFQQAHDRVVELKAFTGSATLVVLPYQGMAEEHVVTLVWSVDTVPTPYPHTISRDQVGSPIRFNIPRDVLEAGKNKQVSLLYTVEGLDAQPVGSQSSTFRILEQSTPLPDRLPQLLAPSEPLLPTDPATLSVQYSSMAEGDELVCYAEGAYPLIQSHRVDADDALTGQIVFMLPVIWLRDNAGWPITLSYQFARKQQALSSEALEIRVDDLWLGGNQLVHVDQAHDRLIDLAVFSGDATLVTFPYADMQAMDEVQVISRWEDGQELPQPLTHVVQPEDIGRPLLFTLARPQLLAAQGHPLRLHLRRLRQEVDPRDYPSQVFKVVHDTPSEVDALEPVRVDGQIPTRLPTRPGGLEVTIGLDSAQVKQLDEVLLLVSSETARFALTKHIDQDDLDARAIVMGIPESFLEAHLDQTVTLSYQIAREGRALSAKALQAPVYRPPVMLDGVLVHVKQAHSMTVDLSTLPGPGILTLLPYPDRARGDKLTVSWGDYTLPTIVVDTDDVTLPLMSEMPREWLQDMVEAGPTELLLTISRDGSPDRLTEPQQLTVLDQDSNPPNYLVPPHLQTPLPGVIYPLPLGIEVTLPAYSGMAEGDEVLFHHYLVEMSAPQWKKLTYADVEKGKLTFTLGKALLDSSVGKTLSLRYQYGRTGEALNSRVLQLNVLQHPAAIEISLVHVMQSHALVIETDSFSDNALLVIPEYQGKAEGDELIIRWARLDQLTTPFDISHTVGKTDLGVTITKSLNKATLDEALNIGAQLSFSVKPVSGSTQRSAVQTFQVVNKASAPPPHLDAPQIAGVVDGKLEPVIEGAKVTINLTSDFTQGTDVILHMNGKVPVPPLAKKLSATDLAAGKLDFRLPGYWLLANAGARVEVFYQYARQDKALSSARVPLEILESEDPTLPGTVVHAKQSHDQVIDLHAFENDAMVYVLPHPEMKTGDLLTVHWQGFDGQEPITEAYSVPTSVSQLEVPFEFILDRTRLEPLSGFAIKTHYTFGNEGVEDPFISASQMFLIVDNQPSPKPLLPPPAVTGESGGWVYPSPEGAWVTFPPPAGQLKQDEALLFADGATSEIVAWTGTPDEPEGVHLSQQFLLENIGERVTLSYQFARPRMALASHVHTFVVAEEQTLPPLTMLGVGSEAAAVDLRTGGRFAIAGAAPLLKGTVTVYVQDTTTVPPRTLLTLAGWTQQGEDFHFAFDRSKSAMLLGKTLKCFYTHIDPLGLSADSAPFELVVKTLSRDSLPYLECESAIGRSELSKARVKEELILNVHGWPLMAAGQLITIVAAEGGVELHLYSGSITAEQAQALTVQAKCDSKAFFETFGIGKTVRLSVEISLAEGTRLTLRDIDLRTVA